MNMERFAAFKAGYTRFGAARMVRMNTAIEREWGKSSMLYKVRPFAGL